MQYKSEISQITFEGIFKTLVALIYNHPDMEIMPISFLDKCWIDCAGLPDKRPIKHDAITLSSPQESLCQLIQVVFLR